MDGTLNLGEKIQVKAFYSYVNGKITTVQNGKDTSYFNLLRRPKHTLNLSVGAQLTTALYTSLQVNAIGERQDLYFDPATFTSQPITLPKYMLVNFYTEYGLLESRIKLFADVRNVLDKTYSDIYGYNTAGLTVTGGVRFRF